MMDLNDKDSLLWHHHHVHFIKLSTFNGDCKQECSLLSLDLDPVTGDGVMNILSHFTGMICAPFQIPGCHYIRGVPRDSLWILHHYRQSLPEH